MPTTAAPPPIALGCESIGLGCDTIVALAAAAADGVVLFGKNSDRPPGEPQAPVLIERATHPAGATVRCQYIEVAQVR
jgi:secernin